MQNISFMRVGGFVEKTVVKIYGDGEFWIDGQKKAKLYPDGEIWADGELIARVYEDGKMLASGEKEELRVQKETVFNGDQSAEVNEVIEYYFGAEQLESIVSLDDFDSKFVYSVSLYSQIGDIMDTSYLAEQFSALGLEYDVEMYLQDGYTIVYDHITQEVTILE